jgi:hypothetical protein
MAAVFVQLRGKAGEQAEHGGVGRWMGCRRPCPGARRCGVQSYRGAEPGADPGNEDGTTPDHLPGPSRGCPTPQAGPIWGTI